MKWTDMRDVADPPVPDVLLIGARQGGPVIHVSERETDALAWMKNARAGRLFRVRVEVLEELEYVPPGEPSLRPKGTPS
jgi:hypothetical protein